MYLDISRNLTVSDVLKFHFHSKIIPKVKTIHHNFTLFFTIKWFERFDIVNKSIYNKMPFRPQVKVGMKLAHIFSYNHFFIFSFFHFFTFFSYKYIIKKCEYLPENVKINFFDVILSNLMLNFFITFSTFINNILCENIEESRKLFLRKIDEFLENQKILRNSRFHSFRLFLIV
jgi:hypothetical protein